VHYILETGEELNETTGLPEPPPHCPGTVAAPAAESGHLCIYSGKETGSTSTNAFITNGPADLVGATGASTTGAIIGFLISATGASAGGTWAVTG
jgi:hypothetical protein